MTRSLPRQAGIDARSRRHGSSRPPLRSIARSIIGGGTSSGPGKQTQRRCVRVVCMRRGLRSLQQARSLSMLLVSKRLGLCKACRVAPGRVRTGLARRSGERRQHHWRCGGWVRRRRETRRPRLAFRRCCLMLLGGCRSLEGPRDNRLCRRQCHTFPGR